ncbi:protein kinase domain protein [Stylonychia lemnae]|uniref:Protein kinase domain protein n=1 Tax=Stylonychia lemnae TaxID=5949 RepID=A0A078B657_STYLE|nr:protein kinase domain protein [Stylonychia lemnae]|eukprot:CDW89711.1 protein kinase domain protein [Stylonychia lemnae]
MERRQQSNTSKVDFQAKQKNIWIQQFQGGFAKCYELRYVDPINVQQKNRVFAVKVVPKASLTRTKARQKDKENVYILLEICQNQSLNELVRRRKRLTELEAQSYLLQLIRACEYLHKFRVIHRDLKLGNLFLSDRMQLKVGDFGLAAKVVFEGEKKRTICGTPNYIAPEILDAKIGHSYEVDYWSIGVILYTLLVGRPPFESPEVKQTYKKIKANQYSFPENIPISEQAKDFVRQLLRTDPSQRMNLKEMLAHDFMTMNKIPELMPISTLVCPPSTTFSKQFQPNGELNNLQFNQTAAALGGFNSIQSARSPTNLALTQNTQRGIASGKETQRAMNMPDLNNGLLATTRDAIGISGYQTIQEEQCKTQREQLRQPTYNLLSQQITPVNNNNFTNQSPRNNEFQFNKSNRAEQQHTPVQPTGRPTSSPFQNDKLLFPSCTGMNSTPRNNNEKRLSTNTVQSNNNYKTEQKSSYSPSPNLNHQTSSKRIIDKENNYLTSSNNEEQHNELNNQFKNNGKDDKKDIEQIAKIEITNAAHFPIESLVSCDKLQQRCELIVQYVDFSSKYGMGYKLSNGQYGVLFNDSTKIVLDANHFHFDYIQRSANGQDEDVQCLNFFNYPKQLNKKVILLQHFKSYLDGNQKFKPLEFKFDATNPPQRLNAAQPSYLKKWKRAKKAILFRLSNKIIQVIFQDLSELILCSGNGIVTFVSSKKQIKKLPLSSDLESKDPSMYKRLQYSKEILIQMINKNDNKNQKTPTTDKIYSTVTSDRSGLRTLEKTQQPDTLISSLAQSKQSEFQVLQSQRGNIVKGPGAELVSLKHYQNNPSNRDLQTERLQYDSLSSTLAKRTIDVNNYMTDQNYIQEGRMNVNLNSNLRGMNNNVYSAGQSRHMSQYNANQNNFKTGPGSHHNQQTHRGSQQHHNHQFVNGSINSQIGSASVSGMATLSTSSNQKHQVMGGGISYRYQTINH